MRSIIYAFLIILNFTSNAQEQKKSDIEQDKLSPLEQYAKKCYLSINGLPKIIKTFGFDPKNMTKNQNDFMDLYDQSYCDCEALSYHKAGKLSDEIVNLPQEKFPEYLRNTQKSDFGKGIFRICDEQAISKAKSKYAKP
ncbi:MAG: hypothetical protein CME65_02800 [Halobacteriovoraceae bacterium]|nr:hypothetical protein [Halobacteriovoraceae bacterium]|tara:strand:- start:1818 stop:2234 length:417 start_codon:yes stop_codon:yes gene_type:complete